MGALCKLAGTDGRAQQARTQEHCHATRVLQQQQAQQHSPPMTCSTACHIARPLLSSAFSVSAGLAAVQNHTPLLHSSSSWPGAQPAYCAKKRKSEGSAVPAATAAAAPCTLWWYTPSVTCGGSVRAPPGGTHQWKQRCAHRRQAHEA
eukprot:GHRQ01020759.1.p2 GENE.GHRQ01020759.1~~GHRQ01020759.1.p2  ORF type:complete len:148 (+),score=17.91 GHRQ01020759.1:332-775(+)